RGWGRHGGILMGRGVALGPYGVVLCSANVTLDSGSEEASETGGSAGRGRTPQPGGTDRRGAGGPRDRGGRIGGHAVPGPGDPVSPVGRSALSAGPPHPVLAQRPVSSRACSWAAIASSTALKAWAWVMAFSVRCSTSRIRSPKKG